MIRRLDALVPAKRNKPRMSSSSSTGHVTVCSNNSSHSLTSGYGTSSNPLNGSFQRQSSNPSSTSSGQSQKGGLSQKGKLRPFSTSGSIPSGRNARKSIQSCSGFETIHESQKTGQCFQQLLVDAELEQFLPDFQNILRVNTISQARFVQDSDLQTIGMTNPELRRFKYFYEKYTKKPNPFIKRMKRMMLPRAKNRNYATWSIPRRGHPAAAQNVGPVVQTEYYAKSNSTNNEPNPQVAHPPQPCSRIIPRDQIYIKHVIGEGEFGTVKQAYWTYERATKIPVAVKILTSMRYGGGGFQDFIKEAGIMQSLEHPHLCKMYGLVIDDFSDSHSLMLVTELAEGRSLNEALQNDYNEYVTYTIDRLFVFAQQICAGMEYLERKRLIHRDLAARNILVFSHDLVKVSDFGLSRVLNPEKDYYQTDLRPNLRLPIAWCAPECALYLKFTSASDVWAYGVTLWEMFSHGQQPWGDIPGNEIIELIDERNNQRLGQPPYCPTALYQKLMLACWQYKPQLRPTFAQISEMLPQLHPQIVTAKIDYQPLDEEELTLTKGETIYVLEERMLTNWKGVNRRGEVGTFRFSHTTAEVDVNKQLQAEIATHYGNNEDAFHRNNPNFNSPSKFFRPHSRDARISTTSQPQPPLPRDQDECDNVFEGETTVETAWINPRGQGQGQGQGQTHTAEINFGGHVEYSEHDNSGTLTEVTNQDADFNNSVQYQQTFSYGNYINSAFASNYNQSQISPLHPPRPEISAPATTHQQTKQVVEVRPFNREQDFSLSSTCDQPTAPLSPTHPLVRPSLVPSKTGFGPKVQLESDEKLIGGLLKVSSFNYAFTAPSRSPGSSSLNNASESRGSTAVASTSPQFKPAHLTGPKHQRSSSETGSRKSMADQVANDRLLLMGGSSSPVPIHQKTNTKFQFKNLLHKQYSDEERAKCANRMIAPGSSPTKYVQKDCSYIDDAQLSQNMDPAQAQDGSDMQYRTLPLIRQPRAKTQNSNPMSRNVSETTNSANPSDADSSPSTSHASNISIVKNLQPNFESVPQGSIETQAQCNQQNVPAVPPRRPISPLSTPGTPGSPSPGSNGPPVPPRTRLYQRSQTVYRKNHQSGHERHLPVRQKSFDSSQHFSACAFTRKGSAPEFRTRSVSSTTSENECLMSPLPVFHQASSAQSSVAILPTDKPNHSNSSSSASSHAGMSVLRNDVVLPPNSHHATTSQPQLHSRHPFNAASAIDGYTHLSETTSDASLSGSLRLHRSTSSDIERPDLLDSSQRFTAIIVNHAAPSPTNSAITPTNPQVYNSRNQIPPNLLAFFSTQKLPGKTKRNSRDECASSNTTLSDARSYEDLFEAKLANEQMSDFESEAGSGSFVNPAFEYNSLEPSRSFNSRVPLRTYLNGLNRIGKSSSFNAGDIPHCQSASTSSGSGGVVTGETMSFSADSIVRPKNFWSLEASRNLNTENYSSLRKNSSISSVQEENEEKTEGKNDSMKQAKIKDKLPSPKKLKHVFQKLKSNESI